MKPTPPDDVGAINAEESGWTTQTLKVYYDALRDADARLDHERDRRYAEVASARAEALKIKEQADRDALGLAREIQTYKDEKANELREQISRERGLYVTKPEIDAAMREINAIVGPLKDFVTQQQGRAVQQTEHRVQKQFTIGQVVTIATFVIGMVITVLLVILNP